MAELNVDNRTIFVGDNLPVLRGINSDAVDLIYLDPPFNSNRNYAAPIGSKAAGAAFSDFHTLEDVDKASLDLLLADGDASGYVIAAAGKAAGESMQAYLTKMYDRLIEMRRVLKPTGSIYLHCDPTAGAWLKALMDAIFGRRNFRNEITWCYTGPGSPRMRQFNRKHDNILWYSMSDEWTFNRDAVRLPHKDGGPHAGGFSGGGTEITDPAYSKKGKVPETWWEIAIAPRSSKEYVGYPTQKPLALLERIIRASSNEGDVVLDPFCGCATTCVAAERNNRRWVGIDLSPLAFKLVRDRLRQQDEGIALWAKDVSRRERPPRRDDEDDPNVLPDPVPFSVKLQLFQLQQTVDEPKKAACNGCAELFAIRNLEIDHIRPRARGGLHIFGNLQLLCGWCNRTKGDRTMKYLRERLREEALRDV